jgi:hypothetical protein
MRKPASMDRALRRSARLVRSVAGGLVRHLPERPYPSEHPWAVRHDPTRPRG